MAERATATEQAVRPGLFAGGVTVLAGAAPVVVLALLVRTASSPLARLDQRVEVVLTRFTLDHPAVRRAAEIGADALHPWVFRGAVLVTAGVLLRRGARVAALWAAGTMAVGSLLGVVLKLVVHRQRPVLVEPVAAESGFSFPSGHALNAALAVTVLILLWNPLSHSPSRAVATLAGFGLVAATSLDRLLLGVHFPTDVIAGDLAGAVFAVSSWVAFGPRRRQRSAGGGPGTTDPQLAPARRVSSQVRAWWNEVSLVVRPTADSMPSARG